VSVLSDLVGYHVNLRYGTSVCWYLKSGLSLNQLQKIWQLSYIALNCW